MSIPKLVKRLPQIDDEQLVGIYKYIRYKINILYPEFNTPAKQMT
jgi:hypothetical protein